MKFFKKQKNSGFTLVELIVVIAILAILAAVAYPVYTGYIKKAHEAADQVLIGAVNEAFTSACIDQGVEWNTLVRDAAKLAIEDDKITGLEKITGISDQENFKKAFLNYFKGNEGTKLKYYTTTDSIKFAGGGVLFTGDQDVYARAAANALKNSGLLVDEKADALLSGLDTISDIFGKGNTIGAAAEGKSLADRLKEGKGATYMAMLAGDTEKIPELAQELMDKYGLKDDSGDVEIGNALILYLAGKTGSMDASQVIEGYKNKKADMSVQMPMMLAVAGAYYKTHPGKGADAYNTAMTSNSGTKIMEYAMSGITDDEDYMKYLQSEDGIKAIEGYLSAMALLSQSGDRVDLSDPDVFKDSDYLDFVNSYLNGGN